MDNNIVSVRLATAGIIHEINNSMTSMNNFFIDDENFCLNLCKNCYEKNIRANCECKSRRETLILYGIKIICNESRQFHEVYRMIGDMGVVEMRDLLFRLSSIRLKIYGCIAKPTVKEIRDEIKYNIEMIQSLFGSSSIHGQNNDDLLTKYNNLIIENKKLREQYDNIRSCIDSFQPKNKHRED